MSNFVVRFLTALVGIPIILGILYVGPSAGWFALCGVAMLIAAWEFLTMTHPDDPAGRWIGMVLSSGVFAALVSTHFGTVHGLWLGVALAALAPITLLASLGRPEHIPTALPRNGALLMAPLYLAVPMAALALVRTFGTFNQGGGLCLLTMMFAWMGDTGGYFAGKGIGGPKLYPSVSPNKTWSGALGGLGGSVLGSVVAHFVFLPALSLAQGVALALAAGAFGQIGDLCESILKRSAGVKDSGAILPGHGGILDRIDALLFCGLTMFVALQSGWLEGFVQRARL
ncbi:MAG: Phosphatidate cytidylyltransferase [Myxococcaceae bacterium]|nr:Phosphatidate cytidylyltransferase [Myxococcaceae bacterium]